MGQTLSRSDGRRGSEYSKNYSRQSFRSRYKKQPGSGRGAGGAGGAGGARNRLSKRNNDDLYKRALIEDYNAWLRQLPPTTQNYMKEEGKDQTLMRKVSRRLN